MSYETSKSPAPGAKATNGLPVPASSSPSTSSSRSSLWAIAPGGLKEHLMTQVNPDLSTIPLAAYCFMTGWMCVALALPRVLSFFFYRAIADACNSDAICFSAIFVWCGFQTGNSLQVTSFFPSPLPRPAVSPQHPVNPPFLYVGSSRSRSLVFSRALPASATRRSTSRTNRPSPR